MVDKQGIIFSVANAIYSENAIKQNGSLPTMLSVSGETYSLGTTSSFVVLNGVSNLPVNITILNNTIKGGAANASEAGTYIFNILRLSSEVENNGPTYRSQTVKASNANSNHQLTVDLSKGKIIFLEHDANVTLEFVETLGGMILSQQDLLYDNDVMIIRESKTSAILSLNFNVFSSYNNACQVLYENSTAPVYTGGIGAIDIIELCITNVYGSSTSSVGSSIIFVNKIHDGFKQRSASKSPDKARKHLAYLESLKPARNNIKNINSNKIQKNNTKPKITDTTYTNVLCSSTSDGKIITTQILYSYNTLTGANSTFITPTLFAVGFGEEVATVTPGVGCDYDTLVLNSCNFSCILYDVQVLDAVSYPTIMVNSGMCNYLFKQTESNTNVTIDWSAADAAGSLDKHKRFVFKRQYLGDGTAYNINYGANVEVPSGITLTTTDQHWDILIYEVGADGRKILTVNENYGEINA